MTIEFPALLTTPILLHSQIDLDLYETKKPFRNSLLTISQHLVHILLPILEELALKTKEM